MIPVEYFWFALILMLGIIGAHFFHGPQPDGSAKRPTGLGIRGTLRR